MKLYSADYPAGLPEILAASFLPMRTSLFAAFFLWFFLGLGAASAQTDTIPPSVPTGLAASAITINSFTLTWTASTDNVGVTAYEIFRGTTSLGTVAAPALSLTVTGLAPNTAYAMKVRARDAAGRWSAQSIALTVKTLADTTPPAIPSGFATSALTATGLTLTWSASTDGMSAGGRCPSDSCGRS